MATHTLNNNLPKKTVNRSYIVFDGMDLTGKTSCIEAINSHLVEKRYNVCLTKGFGGGALGKHIRQEFIPTVFNGIALNKHSSTYEALAAGLANIDAYETDVLPSLKYGKVVISDRALSCFYAYQVYANTDKQISFITDTEKLALEVFNGLFSGMNVHPGLYLFFKCSDENYTKRMSKRKESNMLDHRGLDYMHRVTDGYKKFSTLYGSFAKAPEIYWIDADRSQEEVIQHVKSIVDTYFEKHFIVPSF